MHLSTSSCAMSANPSHLLPQHDLPFRTLRIFTLHAHVLFGDLRKNALWWQNKQTHTFAIFYILHASCGCCAACFYSRKF